MKVDFLFQAPKPAEPWEGIRDALKEGSMAPQTGIFTNSTDNNYVGDEDCLFINVFTPKVTHSSSSELTTKSVEIINLHFKILSHVKIIFIFLKYSVGIQIL